MRAKRNLPALDRRPDRASAAGFTVAELLVVLVVFAMLLALAIPRIDSGVRRARLQQAKGELTTAHFLARTSAMRYGRPATLRIDAPNARFWVEVDTSLAGGRKDTIGVVHRMTEGGVTMTTNRSALCFDRRGLGYAGGACESPDALITFTMSGRTDTVLTSLSGKIIR